MVYISDLQQLLSQWQERAKSGSQPTFYKDALNDCVYELNSLIEKSVLEDADYEDMLEEIEADNYLSSVEAHESFA